MSLTDIPFAVFLDLLVPHLEVKEIGSLSMVNKDLKEYCDDNLVWREMYLRTVRCTIDDNSVHIFRGDVHVTYGSYWYVGEYIPPNIVSANGTVLPHFLPCLSIDVRPKIPSISPALVNGYFGQGGLASSPDLKVILERRKEYSEVIRGIWQEHNRSLGLSTVNLCQCTKHYQCDTLVVPASCKNSKSYKTIVLSKMQTQVKKPVAPLEYRLRQKQRAIQKMEYRLAKLRACEADMMASHAKKSRLSLRLATAVTSMKDAVTREKEAKKATRMAKKKANEKKKTSRLAKKKAREAKKQ